MPSEMVASAPGAALDHGRASARGVSPALTGFRRLSPAKAPERVQLRREQDGEEPIGVDRPRSLVSAPLSETLGVRHRQRAHERRELPVLGRPEDEMPMIWHQAVPKDSDPRRGLDVGCEL